MEVHIGLNMSRIFPNVSFGLCIIHVNSDYLLRYRMGFTIIWDSVCFLYFLHLKMFVGINLMRSIFWPHQEFSVSVHGIIFGGPWFEDECISFYYFYHIKPLFQNISNWLFHLLVVLLTFVFMFCATFLIFNFVGQYHLFPWIPASRVILMI